MMSLWDALRMNMMISYQELVRTFLNSLAFRAAAPADNKLEQHAFAHARDYERYLD